MNKKVYFVVLAKEHSLNLALERWVNALHIYPSIICDKHNVVAARNSAVDDFLRSGATHLVFMDNSIWPDKAARALLDGDDPAVYLGYCTSDGNTGHVGNENFGCSCCRIARECFEAISPPYFEYELDEKNINVLKCECQTFRDKIVAAGFETKMLGTVAHVVTVLEKPAFDGKLLRTTRQQFLR